MIAILALALAVRGFGLSRQSFNMDETYEITAAKWPVREIVQSPDSMPPLFLLTLKGWLSTWGSDSAARWLSVVLGVATVAAVAGVGRELVSGRVGLVAAALAAVSPFHVHYSAHVRSYSLFYFLAVFSMWMLLRALRTNSWRDWTLLIVSAGAGCYTHYYFSAFLVCSIAAALTIQHWKVLARRAYFSLLAVTALGAGVLFLLPRDFTFQSGFVTDRPFSLPAFCYTYYALLAGYTLGPSQAELHTLSLREATLEMRPWALPTALAALILARQGAITLGGRSRLSSLVLWSILPVLVVGLAGSSVGLHYHVRFVGWCLFPLLVWTAAGLVDSWTQYSTRAAGCIVLALCGASLFNYHLQPRYWSEDFRAVSETIAMAAAQGDSPPIVYVVSDYMHKPLAYYLADSWHCHREQPAIVPLPRPNQIAVGYSDLDAGDAIRTIMSHTEPGESFWLVYSRPFHGDPNGRILDRIQATFHVALDQQFIGGSLYRGRRDAISCVHSSQ
jgi:4-amino-4-deoxy-L-arabinose transferase-like glycosyltransferase